MSSDLHRFLRAAAQAPWVWACRRGGHLDVRPLPHGQVPDGETQADGAALLLEALAEAYGAAAADQSRQVLVAQQVAPGRPMASNLVRELVACAEAASSLFDGQRFVLRLSLSARMGGAGFLAACREAGIDPGAVHDERRQSIDAQMAPHFVPGVDLTAEEGARLLNEILRRADH